MLFLPLLGGEGWGERVEGRGLKGEGWGERNGGRGTGDFYVSTVFSIFLFPYRYRCLQCKDFDMCQVSENETANVVLKLRVKQKRIRMGG